ncbi:MAG: LLM class flavin-dependent oxidoreductase [Dehalococcoidia bacterium]|nr:LLM class flavin-dependent oxidoreductase [Dehalococcoidia bacterium]
MRIAIGFGGGPDWARAAAFVQEAEKLGVDFCWTAETWGFDAATPIGYLAGKTEKIQLGTGIMQLGSRSPAMLGMTAMTLNSMSNGRFTLGLGASGPQVVEGWHGVRFANTLPRIRDAVNIVRMVTRGERVAYKGEYYELPLAGGEGKALKSSAPPMQIPVYLATLSPKSLELTGEIADGWIGTSFMPEHADVFFDHLRRGAERAGRSLADIDIQAAGGVVQFSDDLERIIPPRKPGLAFTLGAMGSRQHNFYNAAYRRAGYADEAVAVQKLWLDGKRDEAAALVPDEMVLQTNLLGTEQMIRERIRTHRDAGVNTIRVQPEGSNMDERLETLARVVGIVREEAPE